MRFLLSLTLLTLATACAEPDFAEEFPGLTFEQMTGCAETDDACIDALDAGVNG